MVAARYIEERYLNPLRAKRIKREEEAKKRIREEARAKGLALAQARAKTLALGHALADAEWGVWNERRLAAEAKGEPFDEPTPATLRNRSLTMAQLRATGPLHLGHLAAPAPVRGRFLRVGRLVQGPARGLVLGQGALELRPGRLAHGPHRPAERTAGGLGETGLLRPDRGPEQLHPPWEQRQPGREARPGRPAQGRGYHH